MKKIIYLLAVMMALSNAAFAKLGETPQEIEARYGKPKASGTGEYDHLVWRRYSHLDYEITVRFIEGKSACEKLIHRDETQKFPDVECLGLGKAISGETNWNLLDRKGVATAWVSGDTIVLRSELTSTGFLPFLEITGKVYRDHMEEKREAESARQIDAVVARFNGTVESAKN